MTKHVFTWFKNWYLYGTIAIVYVVCATFAVNYYRPINAGLDNSWQYAINYLPNSSYLFGRDVVFSYGPLGYLLQPQNLGNNIMNSMIFLVAMHSLFTLSLFYFLYREKRKLQVILFAASYLITHILFLRGMRAGECSLLLPAGLLLGISFDNNKIIKYTSASVCCVLAALFLFIKLNLGVVALAMLIVYAILVVAKQRQQAWRILLVGGITYFTTVLIVAFTSMKSLSAIIQWFRYSMDMVGGYSEAMSGVGSFTIFLRGVLSLVIYFTLTLILWRQKAQPRHIALIFMVPVFLAFKQGFCRQDASHEAIFFAFCLGVLCVLILNAVGKKEVITCMAVFIIILAISPTYPFGSDRNQLAAYTADLLQGKSGWANVHAILHCDDIRLWLDEQSKTNLATDELPSETVDIIKSDGGTVDVLPWEISYCPANNLSWDPNPVLQIYSAYTASLDQWSASHYDGNRAPEFLIVEFMDIDGRHPLLGAPATWRSVISNYGLALWDSPAGRLLLKRNMEPSQEAATIVNQETAYINQWIVVPPSDNLLFVDIDMRATFLGTAAKTLFRIPPVYIDLVYESGRAMSYRIIPDTAKDGLLINYLPSNAEELSKLFTGTANDRVTQFRISGPGSLYYNKKMILTWKESAYPIKFEELTSHELVFIGSDTLSNVETVNGRLIAQLSYPIVIDAQREERVTITGWAVDQNAQKAAVGVFITIDGRIDILAFYGFDRRDVADYFENSDYRFSGFSASFDTFILDKGQHTLSLKIVTADKKGYYQPEQTIVLEVR